MVDFKVVLSDRKTGRSYKIDVAGGAAGAIMGKRIGEEVEMGPMGLPGYRMEITGGSDRTGTPARRNLPYTGRRRLLVAGGVGFYPTMDGMRRRKSFRGNEVTADFVQINGKVTSYGEKPLDDIFKKPEEKPSEGEKKE